MQIEAAGSPPGSFHTTSTFYKALLGSSPPELNPPPPQKQNCQNSRVREEESTRCRASSGTGENKIQPLQHVGRIFLPRSEKLRVPTVGGQQLQD